MSTEVNLHEAFAPYVEKGLIKKVKHPLLSLWLYNYTMDCTMQGAWDEFTCMARGVVVNAQGKRIVRNMDKFFNYDEPLGKPLAERALYEPHLVTEKMDGSLVMATLINDWNTPLVHTRGSFRSPQTFDAYEWLRREHGFGWMREGWTYCFEWIAPNNRIVLNYGDREELVMLCAQPVEGDLSETRHYVTEWAGKYAEVSTENLSAHWQDADMVRDSIPNNEEGYVVHLKDGSRFKIKGSAYIRRHRVVNGLTEKRVWECLSNGDDPKAGLKGVIEEEDFQWLQDVQDDLVLRHKTLMDTALRCGVLVSDTDVRDIGKRLKDEGYDQSVISLVYMLRRGQLERAERHAWKELKPEGRGRMLASGLSN